MIGTGRTQYCVRAGGAPVQAGGGGSGDVLSLGNKKCCHLLAPPAPVDMYGGGGEE